MARFAVPPDGWARDAQPGDVRPAGVRRAAVGVRRLGSPAAIGLTGPGPDIAGSSPPARIRIPSPALVVLVGAAGAGKSTLARRLFSADEILSSDELRGAIRGDPTDQSLTRVAFKILHREVVRRLAARRTVVIDATNLTHGARASLVRRAAIAGIPPVAVVLIPPGADVHARNHSRSAGVVPADIVDRQLAAAAALGVDPTGIVNRLTAEGFVAAHVLTTSEEIARVAVERVSR